MTIHEQLEAFWTGEKPDRIPYTIYQYEWSHTKNHPAWKDLFEAGLGVTWHVPAYRTETRDLDINTHDETRGDNKIRTQVMKTPKGELTQTWRNGWQDQHLLKSGQDYRIMTEIVRNTKLIPQHDCVERTVADIAPHGVALLAVGRTPLQTILVDYAGLENFAYHMVDFEEEVRELYNALLVQFRRRVEITAGAPGRFVSNLENFTAESLGPQRFEEFLLPVYNECFPILHEADKIVGSHYDGRTASCRELIAEAPIDLIESLTEPSEGDQTLAEARAAWPDKLFWSNIRVGDYGLPPDKLRTKVLEMIEQGSVDGRQLAFEVSEHCPRNWQESIPVVLDTLREAAG